jgi:hypothetical protein
LYGIFLKRIKTNKKGETLMELCLKNCKKEEVIELDLNKPWPCRKTRISRSLEMPRTRKLEKKFITIL